MPPPRRASGSPRAERPASGVRRTAAPSLKTVVAPPASAARAPGASARKSDASFALRVVRWQKVHGRHDLPWQSTQDAYRIWLSEIMLQQTQVTTVLPYYARFLAAFPDVAALAAAGEDRVLELWSGLGYYRRAHHLHAAAKAVVARHGGVFPTDVGALAALPGIGRSTAAAIAVFSSDARRGDPRRQREARARAASRHRRLSRRTRGGTRTVGGGGRIAARRATCAPTRRG